MILGERYYKMSNAVFCYQLTPAQLTVYSYIVCTAGQKKFCWPSVRTIAKCCGCSENTARSALYELARRGFIEIEHRHSESGNRQTSNRYLVLDLPPLHQVEGPPPTATDEQYSWEQGKDSAADLLPA